MRQTCGTKKKLKAGDEVIVVYSIKNPKIINYANE